MSKQANPTVIGSFVVGAVVLVVVGILIFSSGQFFGEKLFYVLYFEDNLKGLNPGAPVMFRGSKVGTVSDIKVVIDSQDQTIRVPVFIELDEEEVDIVNPHPDRTQGSEAAEMRDREFIAKMVKERGLRAQLEMQSLVTGQLLVQLDFFPDSPIKLHPEFEDQLPEFPTVPSSLKELTRKLEDLPLKDLVQSTLHAIESLDRLLSSPEVMSLGAEVKRLVVDFRSLVKDLDRELPRLVMKFEDVIGETRGLVRNIDRRIEPMASTFHEVAGAARTSLEQAQRTLSAIEGVVGKDSQVGHRLSTALKEIGGAARSVRDLADYLERHPEALLQGKN